MENYDVNPGEAVEQGDLQRATQEYVRRFAWLERLTDDELQKISFCEFGAALESGEEYFDISHPERGIITAESEDTVPEGSCYVARKDVNEKTWRDLTSRMP